MKVFVFPGQGSQFEGMGADLYASNPKAKALFDKADEILGFGLSQIMFKGSAEELKRTDVTQPAIFVYSYIKSVLAEEEFAPDAVAGHSLGEFTALTSIGVLSFEDGLRLVQKRANAMQQACVETPGTMAAILGLEDSQVEEICASVGAVVVPANYNCPGQLVISGSVDGIDSAVEKAKKAGARRALVLPVGGAFHSPLMSSAQTELSNAIQNTSFQQPRCPIYQNVTASAINDVEQIKVNLEKQLTSPVRWTQSMMQMKEDGLTKYVEVGARVLTGMFKKLDRAIETEQL